MEFLLKLLVVLTYTDAPNEQGEFEPSYLWRMIGGWDDVEQVNDAAVLPEEKPAAGPCKAREKLLMAEAANPEDEGEDFQRLRFMNGDKDGWNQEFAERMLKRYERSFELLDEMMEEPEIRLQVPSYGRSDPDDVFTILKFARPYRLRTRMLREGGAWAEAVESLADQNRYANFVIESPGPLINFLIGMACERACLDSAEEMLSDPALPPQHMNRIREILQDGPNRRAGLIRTWKHEYLYHKDVVKDLANGLTIDGMALWAEMMDEKLSLLDEMRSAAARCGLQLGISLAFQPNRTLQMSVTMTEHAIAQSGLSFAERARAELPPLFAEERTWRDYLHSNGMADYVLQMAGPYSLKALDRADHVESYRQALLAVWGTRRFHQLHDRLPESLRELVPDLLAAVPRDPYDGGRIKYSAEKERVWVVGEDLANDGGMDEARFGFRASRPGLPGKDGKYDPTLFLEWLEPDQPFE